MDKLNQQNYGIIFKYMPLSVSARHYLAWHKPNYSSHKKEDNLNEDQAGH